MLELTTFHGSTCKRKQLSHLFRVDSLWEMFIHDVMSGKFKVSVTSSFFNNKFKEAFKKLPTFKLDIFKVLISKKSKFSTKNYAISQKFSSQTFSWVGILKKFKFCRSWDVTISKVIKLKMLQCIDVIKKYSK